jgi:hypothetical protein
MMKQYRSLSELDASLPDKHEVAEELGIPLNKGNNGNLSSRQVGRIGGAIGGAKVRKMIAMAEEALSHKEADH